MISYKLFNFDTIKNHADEKRKPGNPGHAYSYEYLSDIHTFDIETSVVEVKHKKHALIYMWQIMIDDTTYFGRRIEELQQFMENLCDAIPTGKRLVLWVHNLGYEFQFIRDLFFMHDVFMRSNRQPLRATIDEKIELRDSFALSGKSLDEFCKSMNVINKKSASKYDHNKLRTPDTILTDYEMEYGETDCTALKAALKALFELNNDNLYSIPWTMMGYNRRDIKRNTHDIRRKINTLKPSFDLYEMLQRGFRGGLCDSNIRYADITLNDVISYDIESSYLRSILCKKFPMKPFKEYCIKTNGQPDIDRFAELDRCWIADVEIWNIKAKDSNIRYLDTAKCECIGNTEIYGKVVSADYMKTTITDIDLYNIDRCYDYDDIKFTNMYYSVYDKLPIEFRSLVKEAYSQKTKLKGTDDIAEYNHRKEKANGFYGIMVQNLMRDQIVYDEENGEYSTEHRNSLEAYKKISMLLPYQWGVWTTAHARTALIDAALLLSDYWIYSDTDSQKFRSNAKAIAALEKLKDSIIAEAIENDATALDKDGKMHYVGQWMVDAEYSEFKTLAPKMYVGKTTNGEIKITISGVNKEAGSKAISSVDEITYGYKFPENCSKYITYNDLDKPIEWNGYKIYSNMVINNYEFEIENPA